jgi:hypothetical protein
MTRDLAALSPSDRYRLLRECEDLPDPALLLVFGVSGRVITNAVMGRRINRRDREAIIATLARIDRAAQAQGEVSP